MMLKYLRQTEVFLFSIFISHWRCFISLAVIEFVRDACTVRAVLLPDYTPVMVAMTGIRVRIATELGFHEGNF